MTEKHGKKELVIPGEIIATGDEFLPGDWTLKQGNDIISSRYGVVEKQDRLIKIIPISGVYIPRSGNTVIGEIKDLTNAGWVIDIGGPYQAFLPLRECPGFVEESEMENIYGIGDLILTQVLNVKRTSVDLTMKMRERGFGKIREGSVIRVNPHRVPRVIGKEGSMVSLIKNASNCMITVGQNGLIWIQGNNIDEQIYAEKAIQFIVENITTEGLTEKAEKWLADNKPKITKEKKE